MSEITQPKSRNCTTATGDENQPEAGEPESRRRASLGGNMSGGSSSSPMSSAIAPSCVALSRASRVARSRARRVRDDAQSLHAREVHRAARWPPHHSPPAPPPAPNRLTAIEGAASSFTACATSSAFSHPPCARDLTVPSTALPSPPLPPSRSARSSRNCAARPTPEYALYIVVVCMILCCACSAVARWRLMSQRSGEWAGA